jgi:hypothetical protein
MIGGVIQLGEKLATSLGEGPGAETLAAQRARLVEAASTAVVESTWSSKRRAAGITLAFAVAALALVVLGVRWLHPRPALHATWNGATVVAPSVFEAATSRPQSLEFSEGSQILLEPDTRASLSRLSAKNADLTLDEGHILASIHKHTGITWTFAAGPYRVRVIGTRFTIDWDAERHQLRVAVREGRVKVSGGDLPGEGVVLDAGALLERGAERAHLEGSGLPASPAESAVAVPSEPSKPAASGNTAPHLAPKGTVETGNTTGEPTSNDNPALPTWNTLAKQGKYKEALALAEKLGFDSLTNSLGEDDLLLLANAARYGGDASRAHLAQLKVRERFAGHRSAALAAFYLARSALDVEHRPESAIRWFETFLSESPRGDLAALARANLMSLWLNMGQREKARSVAQDYLHYHPDGAQSVQARSLVQSPP